MNTSLNTKSFYKKRLDKFHLFTYIYTICSCCRKPWISVHLKKRKIWYLSKHILRIKHLVRRGEYVKFSELKSLVRLYVSLIFFYIDKYSFFPFFSIIPYLFFSLLENIQVIHNTYVQIHSCVLVSSLLFSLSHSFSAITLEYNRGCGWIMHFIDYWSFLFNNISKNVHHKRTEKT